MENHLAERLKDNDEKAFLWPQLEELDLNCVFFEQSGATCHTSGEIIDILKKVASNISFSWCEGLEDSTIMPLRNNLTPLDYCLWGYIMLLGVVQTSDLKINIEGSVFGELM